MPFIFYLLSYITSITVERRRELPPRPCLGPVFFLVRRPRRDLVPQTKCLAVVERFPRKDISPD